MNHRHVVVVDGRIVLVSDFARAAKKGAEYAVSGHRVFVKPASRADWSVYRRAIAR